ncbi:outer membrane beta-barrel protein [Piscinibacter sp. HJYY11]|uniref:outer membrane beta-barrel protein n=1 Tax=Piscinibacter sp. HJYY11 TaxID=2801333 RepID=UPI00191D50F6|nr:outer membrane beta-barrel protein [Piscinibacter sp. HJYY11]MBL0727657.1 outer membrane beta-barrel protein [Piscinibacter sp. HJYY11]
MKTIQLAVAAAALTLSSAAMAQSAYVTGNVGLGYVDACDDTPNCDDSSTAFKFVGGYDFGAGLAAELGYIDFGKARFSVPGFTADFKVSGPTFGFAYNAPLSKDVGLNMRLGIANLKTKISATASGFGSASDSETNSVPYFGLGLNFAVAQNVRFEAGVDFSRGEYDTEKADVRALTFGLRVKF